MLIISLLAIFAGRHAELVLESAGDRQAGGQQHHSRHSVVIVFAHVLTLYCFYNLLGMHCQYGHKESAGPVHISGQACYSPYTSMVGDCAMVRSPNDVSILS